VPLHAECPPYTLNLYFIWTAGQFKPILPKTVFA
jgi:hypothetical protein